MDKLVNDYQRELELESNAISTKEAQQNNYKCNIVSCNSE